MLRTSIVSEFGKYLLCSFFPLNFWVKVLSILSENILALFGNLKDEEMRICFFYGMEGSKNLSIKE
jgi:hypothetical protein